MLWQIRYNRIDINNKKVAMSKKFHKDHELIFGIQPLREVLKARRRPIHTVYTTKPAPKAWDALAKQFSSTTKIQFVSRDILTKMAGTTDHQSVVAFVGPLSLRRTFFSPQQQPFLVMLDGIQDPRNLGAILRSSSCIGADGVILCKKGGAPLNAIALKASAGLLERLDIWMAPSPSAAAIELKKAGYAIYLAALGGKSLQATSFQEPLCLVIGSEGLGISSEIRSSGTAVMIPQKDSSISYNASVAAGILLHWIAISMKRLS